MIIYFANRAMDILGLASTELADGFHISDDNKSEDIDTGVKQFECSIHWNEESRNLAQTCAAAGNYLLRSNGEEAEFYTIIECEEDTKDRTIYIYAEDAGMDLLNETVGAFAATSAHPAAWYIETFAEDSGFEIGINEISSLSRQLVWTGEATVAERIASVATQFDNAEIGYSFDISGLTVTHKYINIYAQRGQDAGVTLRLNREVDRIVTTTSVADLATALEVTGGIPEGEEDAVTLVGYTDYDYDDDVYSDGSGLVKSRSALAVWSRYVNPSETGTGSGHIVKQWSYDTTSQSELFHRAVTQLKKIYSPAVNYDVETTNLPDGVEIGDYVYIVDEGGNLYLQSRILQMQTSVCNETVRLTLGDYVIDSGGLSSQVSTMSSSVNMLTSCIKTNENGNLVISSNSYTPSTIYIDGALSVKEAHTLYVQNIIAVNGGGIYIGNSQTSSITIGCESSETMIRGNSLSIDTSTRYDETITIGEQFAAEIIIGRYTSMYPCTTRIQGNEIQIADTGGEVYIKGSEYTGSDERLKTLIQPLNGSSLDNLTPVSFKWRDGDDMTHYGYIAQEVQGVMPELVHEDKDGMLYLSYTEIIPLLHRKINELEERLKKLEVQNG